MSFSLSRSLHDDVTKQADCDIVKRNNECFNNVATKPRKPLSAYNLFFQLESQRILQGSDHLRLPISLEELRQVSQTYKQRRERRSHRKSNSCSNSSSNTKTMGFAELAQIVAERWDELDSTTRNLIHNKNHVDRVGVSEECWNTWNNWHIS